MNSPTNRPRLVLALEAGSNDPPGLLAAAAGTAAGLRADLDVFLVEDENILYAAQLPDTWLVPAHGASTKIFDATTIRRAFRVRSADVRKQLADCAEARALRWSFKSESGLLGDFLAEIATGTDIVVLCHARRRRPGIQDSLPEALRRLPANLLLYNRDSQIGERIVALYTGEEMVLSAARALATGVELPLEILVLADNVETLKTRAADAGKWLETQGPTSAPGGILMDGDDVWVERLAGSSPATFVCTLSECKIPESVLVRLADTKSVMIVRG
jgi:hypothetical protein